MGSYYSEQFKLKMLRQMVGPNAKTAVQLARETGVGNSTLSRWLQDANGIDVKRRKTKKPKVAQTRRPEDWTPQEKLHLVMEASGLSDEELGAFLRKQGLHEIHLKNWRETVLNSLARHPGASNGQSQRIRKLERELQRKEKALAEAAALLVLQKKVQEIWGDEDDDIEPRSDK